MLRKKNNNITILLWLLIPYFPHHLQDKENDLGGPETMSDSKRNLQTLDSTVYVVDKQKAPFLQPKDAKQSGIENQYTRNSF